MLSKIATKLQEKYLMRVHKLKKLLYNKKQKDKL